MNILVMESSTTSAKAMLYRSGSHSIHVLEKPYYNIKTDDGTQDPDDIFHKTVHLARQLCADQEIGMIVLSGTYHSVMLLDRGMRPQTPSYLWSYTGAKELCANLRTNPDYVRDYYRKTGCMVHALYPFFKLKFLKSLGHDIKSGFIMGQGAYNFYRMTGIRAEMDSMASGTGLFNINDLDYDRSLLAELGIDEDHLPVLARWNETRPLTKEAAAKLGIKPGIPVMTAGPDGALNQVGSDALAQGIMTLSVGTSAALRMSVASPNLSKDMSTWCYLSPKQWLSGAAVSGGCNCVDWVRHLMFPAGISYADCEKGMGDPDAAPVFLPFLYGERCPGWNDEREASFAGVRPDHTPADFYYSVQEGVLFNIYQCFERLCALNGIPREIKISGGILNSPRWLQMCADLLGSELTTESIQHSSMAGGLKLALELAGIAPYNLATHDGEKKRIVPQKETHDKLMERFKIYEDNYNQ